MPTKLSKRESASTTATAADTALTNPRRNGDGHRQEVTPEAAEAVATTPIDPNRNGNKAKAPTMPTNSQGDINPPTSNSAGATEKRVPPVHPEVYLSVPGNATAEGLQRRTESSAWDWHTPLDSEGENLPFFYEPQGELLQDQADQQWIKKEFSIPTVVGSDNCPTAASWSVEGSAVSSNGNGGFAVPTKPAGGMNPSPVAGVKRKSTSDRETQGIYSREPTIRRTERDMSDLVSESYSPSVSTDPQPPSDRSRSQAAPVSSSQSMADTVEDRPETNVPRAGVTNTAKRTVPNSTTPMALPARKVFPIQIGDKLFRLSGASISSDAPSYFSKFFEDQLRQSDGADSVRTLYIDRDPATFEDIALHLQGYHIEPRDGEHFVKLFADAQFFSLPRLKAHLFSSTIYIRIGDTDFQIPRDLFSNPGDSPNYFTLGFTIFFTTPTEVFPGLSEQSLLRPPSLLPPSVPNRSARTFADLLHILKGYPLQIRNEEHRTELLRDARYFHLKGLEQRLIPHSISYNLARKSSEIVVRLEDIRQSGVSFVADSQSSSSSAATSPASAVSSTERGPGWIYYQRPYVDSEAHCLIVEIGGEESTFLVVSPSNSAQATARFGRATFHRVTLARITSLLGVIANKMNLPVTQPLGLMMMERGGGVASLPVSPGNTGVSDERVKVRIGSDADVTVDGRKWHLGTDADEEDDGVGNAEVTRGGQGEASSEPEEWAVKKAQWRLRVQPMYGGPQTGKSGMEVILGAVKIEAFASERGRNETRGFLG